MSEKNLGFIETVTGVLRRPTVTFPYIQEGDLMKGAVIVVVAAVLAGVSTMTYMNKIPLEVILAQVQNVSVDVSSLQGTMGMFSAIGVIIAVLAGWALSTLLFHALSNLLGGKGDMKRFFAMTGFASTPLLLKQVIRMIDAFTISQDAAVGFFLANREIGNKLLTWLMGANLLNIFGLATLYLTINAINANYGLGKGKALVIALIPPAVSLAMTLFL